jgi:uroporphyrinogen-III synthase
MRLLVTRPEPEASRTAEALRARGHHVDIAPLLRIEADADADLGAGPWAGIVITSANAARAAAAHSRKAELLAYPVFAVGRRSAAAARAQGFAEVASADGDAAELARLLAARAERGRPLLYLAGEDRAADLESMLAAHGVALRTVVVYRAIAATALPPAVGAALAAGAYDGVLHYSARSARAFAALAPAAGIDLKSLKPMHYCLSAQVAAPLRAAGAAGLAVAARPDEGALLALIA